MKKKIEILIADDHSMIRSGLILMLENQKKFIPIIEEATNGKEVIELVKDKTFDIILLDITMPEMDGIAVLKKLKTMNCQIPVIMLTMHKEEGIIKQALELGALGYLLKNSGLEEITKAIKTVTGKERFFSNEISQLLFNDKTNDMKSKSRKDVENNLTKREVQILEFIVKEYTSVEIAELFNVSKRTIETHRNKLMHKLNVKSSIGLVKYALKNGFE